MRQLQLPFIPEMDRQLAIARAAAEKKRHEEWAASMLKGMVDQYPPSSEECDIMLMGVRIDRFVSDLECEKCRYATEDHTVRWLFPAKICLKDYYKLRRRQAKARNR